MDRLELPGGHTLIRVDRICLRAEEVPLSYLVCRGRRACLAGRAGIATQGFELPSRLDARQGKQSSRSGLL
jgi:hypothetical protein